MLNTVIEDMRTKQAKLAREVEYLKETAMDDIVDVCTESAEVIIGRESMDEILEAADMVERLSGEPDTEDEAVEVARILEATEDLSFDEMIGL